MHTSFVFFVTISAFYIVLVINGLCSARETWQLADNGIDLRMADGDSCNQTGYMCQNCYELFYCVKINEGYLKEPVTTCTNGETCFDGEEKCSSKFNPNCYDYDYECTSDGMFPDPFDCKRYHICTKNDENTLIDYHGKCDKNYGYDPLSTFCKNKLEGDKCNDTPLPYCTGFQTPTPLLSNPSMYYMCVSSNTDSKFVPILMKCPHGESFDPKLEACVDQSPTTTPAPTTHDPFVTITPSDYICKDKRLHADPMNCHWYYDCHYGTVHALHISCGEGYSFNERKQVCQKGQRNC